MKVGISGSTILMRSDTVAECSCCAGGFFQERTGEGAGGINHVHVGADGASGFVTFNFSYKRKRDFYKLEDGEKIAICTITNESSGSFSIPPPVTTMTGAGLSTSYSLVPDGERPLGQFSWSNGCTRTDDSGVFEMGYGTVTGCSIIPSEFETTCTNTAYKFERRIEGEIQLVDGTSFMALCDEDVVSENSVAGYIPPQRAISWAVSNFNTNSEAGYRTQYPFGFTDTVRSYTNTWAQTYVFYYFACLLSGAKAYRLVYPAVKINKKEGVEKDVYGPSRTGYLKVWIRKTIMERVGGAGEFKTTYTDFTKVIRGEKTKDELLDKQYYTSEDFLLPDNTENIPSNTYLERSIELTIIGSTSDETYTGANPPYTKTPPTEDMPYEWL